MLREETKKETEQKTIVDESTKFVKSEPIKNDFTKTESFEKLVSHTNETAQLPKENDSIPLGNSYEQNILNRQNEETKDTNDFATSLEHRVEKRGRKKGSKNRTTVEQPPQENKNIVDPALLINASIIEPFGGMFLKDATNAMYSKEQGEVLEKLCPTDTIKPSWGAFISIALLMGAGNVLRAYRYEKSSKIVKKLKTEDLVILVNNLDEKQMQFFVEAIVKENQRREAMKKESIETNTNEHKEN